MAMLWAYKARVGTFTIAERHGRFEVLFEEEDLGNYPHPAQAAEDLAGGHTFTPSSGVDPGSLDIPADLSEWEVVRS